MRSHVISFLAVALAFIASGCKMNLAAEVYLSDILEARASPEVVTTPATLAFQIPSVDECAEHTGKIEAIMAGVVTEFQPKGCERVDSDSFLLANTQIPLLVSDSQWQKADALFGLVVLAVETGDIGVALVMNLAKYKVLTGRLDDEFGQSVDLGASKVTLTLRNDLRTTASFNVEGVFLDGAPVIAITTSDLERRHNAEIRFSNVATAHLAKYGSAGGFVLKAPGEMK